MRGGPRYFAFRWGASRATPGDSFGVPGLIVRFLVNVAALWVAQFLIRGFDIDSWPALLLGAAIFGAVNAFIRPVVAFFSCVLTVVTLGLFTLIINTLMLALTAWITGWFDLEFHVDGFIAAFLGALVIALVSTVLSRWADRNVLASWRRRDRAF